MDELAAKPEESGEEAELGNKPLLRHELAAISGVNAETLRFYEKAGLLTPERSANGYRKYAASDLKRLRLIQRAVGLGFGLEEVKGWLEGRRRRCGRGWQPWSKRRKRSRSCARI